MSNKIKWFSLASAVLSFIGGLLMILHGFELIQLPKLVHNAICLCFVAMGVLNIVNGARALKPQGR